MLGFLCSRYIVFNPFLTTVLSQNASIIPILQRKRPSHKNTARRVLLLDSHIQAPNFFALWSSWGVRLSFPGFPGGKHLSVRASTQTCSYSPCLWWRQERSYNGCIHVTLSYVSQLLYLADVSREVNPCFYFSNIDIEANIFLSLGLTVI